MTETTDAEIIEKDAYEFDNVLARKRDAQDSQRLIRAVLASPMEDGPIYEPTGNISFKKLATLNTDIQTKILLRIAYQAAAGDIKSAEFLFKYGGLEPPKEQTVSIQVPMFLDDMINVTPEEDDSPKLLSANEEELIDNQEDSIPVVLEPYDDDDF